MNLLERIVEAIAPKTAERIGKHLENRRDKQHRAASVKNILAKHGVKTTYESWLGDDDWKGNPKEYPITPKMGKPYFEDDFSRFCLVPVHYYYSACGDEANVLFLVDLRAKEAKKVANSGQRGIHYRGHLKYKPFTIKEGKGKVTFAYAEKVRPKFADIFDGDFWYFLRANWPVFYTEKVIHEVEIGKNQNNTQEKTE